MSATTGELLEDHQIDGATTALDFAILGPLEVQAQHRRIEVSSAKERLLLAALVVHANELVSADRLIEVLWAAEPPATAVNTLQTYVSRLRRALEPGRVPRAQDGVLRTRGHGYQLAIPPESVDAVRFERLVRAGRDEMPADPERAAQILRRAAALWRGEPLADFGFELFAQAEIVRLTELRAAALEDRVEADLALGRHAALCSELAHAVTEQPLRERLWSALIRALYAAVGRLTRWPPTHGYASSSPSNSASTPAPSWCACTKRCSLKALIWTGRRRCRGRSVDRLSRWPAHRSSSCCPTVTPRWPPTTGTAPSNCCALRTRRCRWRPTTLTDWPRRLIGRGATGSAVRPAAGSPRLPAGRTTPPGRGGCGPALDAARWPAAACRGSRLAPARTAAPGGGTGLPRAGPFVLGSGDHCADQRRA